MGESDCNRFIGCLQKQSRNNEIFFQLFISVHKMQGFSRIGTSERFFKNSSMKKRLSTALKSNYALYVNDAVVALQNQIWHAMNDEIITGC